MRMQTAGLKRTQPHPHPTAKGSSLRKLTQVPKAELVMRC